MSDSDFQEDSCVICKQGFEKEQSVTVSKKGILNLISYSEKRGLSDLKSYFTERISTTPIGKVLVHTACRRDFTDTKRLHCRDVEVPCAKKLRSSLLPFSWKDDCMFCGKSAAVDTRHPERSPVCAVVTLPFREKLLECCDKRGDSWAAEVQNRLHGCIDLVAAEAVYHVNCYSRFMLLKDQSSASTDKKGQGRPEDQKMMQCFEMLCHWMESEGDADFYTLAELHAKMTEFSGESEVYSIKRLKQKLEEHYKEFIFFAEVEGRSNVVCFRNMAKYIINDKWYSEKKEDIDDEAKRIVTAAAKIIKAEIRERKYDSNSYPTTDDIANDVRNKKWIPHHLQTLLSIIVPSELKQTSIGHCILQAARPRSVITPILFGLGVEVDHVFGSKWLINELSRLGFSISYSEVTRYKQSVIQSERLENLLAEYFPGTFTQWVADNVDHNVATLDGQETFHGMGIIAVSSPKDNTPLVSKSRVIRRQRRLTVDDLVKDKGVPIFQYTWPPKKGLASVIYKPILQLQVPYTMPSELCSDLLWHSGWIFSTATRPRSNWSGFMQHMFSDNLHLTPKSEVLLLPIIDLNPSDETCIYSTLTYIERQAEQLNIPTPCITFDQPLWLKATEIIKAKSMNIVCRLGGFHTMMSFMGSIGSMMKGSGLEEALETVYGPNAVTHMMSGKAVSRALRGHFLVEAALVNKLMMSVLPCKLNGNDTSRGTESDEVSMDTLEKGNEDDQGSSSDMEVELPPSNNGEVETVTHREGQSEGMEDPRDSLIDVEMEIPAEMETGIDETKLDATEVEQIRYLYEGIRDKSIPVASVAESKELKKLDDCLLEYRELLAERSPTAKLWLQYIEYVQILKVFIRAERTGDWNLHLTAITEMLNLFAATGHINYAKSARLYLQLMQELQTDHPWLYHCFTEQGFHTVRRSNRFWAGIWTDLTIEQVMMRSIKSRGGLTRGRGVTETVHLQWIYSMHKCAGIHDAMTSMTNAKHQTSEQHMELGTSRSNRDFADLHNVQEWFNQHEPFDLNELRLRSLSSGLTASHGDGVNCDKTEEVGAHIQKKLDNMNVVEASIKRSDQVRSLDHLNPGIQVEKRKVHIHPNHLFYRLITIAQREEDMAPYFGYELTAMPTSLFKDYFMRKPVKAQLTQALVNAVQPAAEKVQAVHVLDGGALIHRVKWQKKVTYKDITMQYVNYVRARYGNCCIVFDGYGQGPSIKDHEHQRRAGKTCADIQLTESTKAHSDQQTFLSNEKNKSQFIMLLSQCLEADGQIVHNSTGDADTLIVVCALQFARHGREVSVVSDDTDVLVLLMYHWNENMADIYFHSEAKRSQKGLKVWKVKDLVNNAGKEVTSHLLFIHAWSGCDTTSATYGHGKTSLLAKIKQSEELQQISFLMTDPEATVEEIGKAGIRLYIILYGGRADDSLNSLRYAKYMMMVSTSKTSIDPQKLPPTERAAYFHSLRVHLQVILWLKLTNNDLDPMEWGWKLADTILTPVQTDLDAAPESLLKFVRCKCKLSARNPCGNNSCSCRKHGLKCVTACGDCRGESCQNAEEVTLDDEDNVDPNGDIVS